MNALSELHVLSVIYWNILKHLELCTSLYNGLHKTSSGIGSSTLSTATHLINCTALTYTTKTAIDFMRCVPFGFYLVINNLNILL